MKIESDSYSKCDRCGKTINYGNAVVSLVWNVEQIDRTSRSAAGEVTVIDSRVLMTLCAGCGNKAKKQRAGDLLQPFFSRPEYALN